jgi:AMP-activated protein kinase-like protein
VAHLLIVVLAQTQASLGLGVATVRYPGGAHLSLGSLAPAVQFTAPTFTVNASGVVAALPQGDWFLQGHTDGWTATAPFSDGWRLGIEAGWSGTARTGGQETSAPYAVGEVLWAAPTWGAGLGAGPSAGSIAGTPWITAFHARARAWWQQKEGRADWSASVEPTRFLGAWFTDMDAGVRWRRGTVTASVWAQARLSRAYGSKGAASAFLQILVSPDIALEVGAGGILPDPYQGFPRTRYLSAGIRFVGPRHASRADPALGPLLPDRRGDSIVVRFRFPGARAVAIAGDWNNWEPVPLAVARQGDDVWEGALLVPSGPHRFNLLVDGEWVVPHGVATVTDELGGLVALLFVP